MSKKLVEQTIMLLLCDVSSGNYGGKRFYGSFLNNMRRFYNTKGVPTAGVNITDQINLHINLDFFKTLTQEQRMQLLEHECQHVMNYHMKRAKACDYNDQYLWNLACDVAINDPLTSLHEMGITYDKVKKQIKDLKKGETAEYYFKKIKKFRDEQEKKGKNGDKKVSEMGDTCDDHSEWNKAEEGEEIQNEELAKETVKRAMKKAVEQSGGRGNVPNEVLTALDRLNKSTVNWKQHLKRFFARAHKYQKEHTRMKRNRRYGLMYSGRKKKPNVHIAIALDESGSVGNDEFGQFFAEIDKIAENGVQITIIHADCQINNVYEYKPKMKIERTGMGGTAYMPAINEAKKLNVDGMIYFGDGDIFGETLEKPTFPLLWAMVRTSPPPAEWGGVCRVKVENKNE